jgi:hypothetical protein
MMAVPLMIAVPPSRALELLPQREGPLLQGVVEEQAPHQELQALLKLSHLGGLDQLAQGKGPDSSIHAALLKKQLQGA